MTPKQQMTVRGVDHLPKWSDGVLIVFGVQMTRKKPRFSRKTLRGNTLLAAPQARMIEGASSDAVYAPFLAKLSHTVFCTSCQCVILYGLIWLFDKPSSH